MIEKLINPDKGYIKHVAAFQRISGEESSRSCGFVGVAYSFIQLRFKKKRKMLEKKRKNTFFYSKTFPNLQIFIKIALTLGVKVINK